MPLMHRARVAGVIGVNTPHTRRAPVDPIQIFRKRFGDSMYIVQFQDPGRATRPHLRGECRKDLRLLHARPLQEPPARRIGAGRGGIGAPPALNLAFPQIVAAYDPERDPRAPLLTPDEMRVYVDTFRRTGFTGGINWYRNFTRNWERSANLSDIVEVPSLMIMAENDLVLPPSAADGMEAIVPDLEKHLIRGCGHWTHAGKTRGSQREILDWRRRRSGEGGTAASSWRESKPA